MKLEPAGLQDFAERYTEAWCGKEPSRVAEFFSVDGSLRVNSASPAVGRAAIAEVARGFMTAFPDLVVTMDGVEVEGDRAVYRWTLAGTNTGPGGTGHAVRISGFEEWKMAAGGLIAASSGHFDEEEYRRQVAHGV
jgi:hypothetical protein